MHEQQCCICQEQEKEEDKKYKKMKWDLYKLEEDRGVKSSTVLVQG